MAATSQASYSGVHAPYGAKWWSPTYMSLSDCTITHLHVVCQDTTVEFFTICVSIQEARGFSYAEKLDLLPLLESGPRHPDDDERNRKR